MRRWSMMGQGGQGSPSLRILLLYESLHAGQIGGVEERTLELARGLAELGHRVVVRGFAPRSCDLCEGVRIEPLGEPGRLYSRNGRRSSQSAWRWALSMRKVDYSACDVVDAAAVPYLHLWPLALGCRRASRPLVVTWHEYFGAYWRIYVGAVTWRIFAAIERWSLGIGTRLVAVSPYTAARIQTAARREVDTVTNGIPVARVRKAAGQGNAGQQGPVAIYAGRLIPEKRVDLLIEAAAILAPARPGFRVDIVGDGPDRDRLEQLVAARSLIQTVRFLGVQPAKDDVWRRFGDACIAVQPSFREGFGLFPAEAMAAGLPVVYCTSPESAIGELVLDGRHGLKAEPTPHALAASMARLMDDEGLRRRLSIAASKRAEAFDYVEMARATERIYREVLAAAPTVAGKPIGPNLTGQAASD